MKRTINPVIVFLSIIFVCLLWVNLWVVNKGQQQLHSLTKQSVEGFGVANNLSNNFISIKSVVYGYYLDMDKSNFDKQFAAHNAKIKEDLIRLKKLALPLESIKALENQYQYFAKGVNTLSRVMSAAKIDWDKAREVLAGVTSIAIKIEKLAAGILLSSKETLIQKTAEVVAYNHKITLIISSVSIVLMMISIVVYRLNLSRVSEIRKKNIMMRFPEYNPNPVMALDGEKKLIYANQASYKMAQKLGCQSPVEIITGALKGNKKMEASVANHQFKFKEAEFDAGIFWIEEFERYHVFLREITLQKVAENKLMDLAYNDQLSKLPNFSALKKDLPAMVKWTNSFAIVDISNFYKVINMVGYKRSDHVVSQFVKNLRKQLCHDKSKIYRIDRTLFGVVFFNKSHFSHLQEIIDDFKRPLNVDGYQIFLNLSVGLVETNQKMIRTDSIVVQALHALDYARQQSGSFLQVYHDAIEQDNHHKIVLESNLRQAIKNMEFELFYQPKLSLVTGEVCSAEVLIRWCRNGEEWISPQEFIPLAEAIGLIVPLGDWILAKACQTAYDWHQQGHRHVSAAVNVSAIQLMHNNFNNSFCQALERSGLPAQYLELELTETVALQDFKVVQQILDNVRGIGVKVSLDDFGTGYSSLSYLNQLPLDFIKIDRAFVQELDLASDSDKGLAHAIIEMAHSLGLPVIAEGVEQASQMKILKGWGCEYIQGYYFARPMNEESFIDFLDNHQPATWRNKALRK